MNEAAADTVSDHRPDIDKFATIIGAIWPMAIVYQPGTRFRIRNRDSLGYPIPNALRGRTGTVIGVDGPVALGNLHRKANVKTIDAVGLDDVAHLSGLNIEMVHVVRYDDGADAPERLSHTWMERESVPAQPDLGWLDEMPHNPSAR